MRRMALAFVVVMAASAPAMAVKMIPLVNAPLTVKATCAGQTAKDAMLGAFYLDLQKFQWQLSSAEPDFLQAKVCRGGPGSFCVEINVFFIEAGRLEVWLSPFAEYKNDVRETAVSWVQRLMNSYPEFQCLDEGALLEAYNVTQRYPAPSWTLVPELRAKYEKKRSFIRWLNWSAAKTAP